MQITARSAHQQGVRRYRPLSSALGRLSRTWFDKIAAAGLAPGPYVELIGTIVTVVSIDSFHRAMGLAPEPLPEPVDGEPSRYVPDGATDTSAWVPMIRVDGAAEAESDLWPGGRTGNVIRAMSLVPDEVRGLKDLSMAMYLGIQQMMDLDAGRAIDRRQIELVAGRVCAINECFY